MFIIFFIVSRNDALAFAKLLLSSCALLACPINIAEIREKIVIATMSASLIQNMLSSLGLTIKGINEHTAINATHNMIDIEPSSIFSIHIFFS